MCAKENHVAGHIGTKQVRVNAWDREIVAFEAKLDDFNTLGHKEQVNHPGHVTRFNFCPECGASMAGIGLRGLSSKG